MLQRLHSVYLKGMRIMHRTFAALSLGIVLSGTCAAVRAEETLVQAELRNGWQTRSGTQMSGLHLQLAPGWKTYWRAPGDAGIPPTFDWSGSRNVQSVRVHWPAPHVFTLNGLRSIGYTGDVVLPVEVTPKDGAKPVHLVGKIALGVCKDICVPSEVLVDVALETPGAADATIRAALDAVPMTGAAAGLTMAQCQVEPIADGLRLRVELDLPATGGQEVVVIEPSEPEVWVSEADVQRKGGRLIAVSEMVDPSGTPFVLDRGAVTLTVLGADRAVEVKGCTGG